MADRLAVAHRKAQLAIRAQVMRELVRLWPAMDWTALDATFPAWSSAVGTLITAHRAVSTSTAASFLRRHRLAAGIPGPAPIVLAAPLPPEQLSTSLATTALWAAKAAAARGVTADRAMANAFVRSSGAATRLVLDGGRQTLARSMEADSRCVGYRRVTSGNACSFCAQLATWAEGNASLNTDFKAHDHCGCSAQPVYG